MCQVTSEKDKRIRIRSGAYQPTQMADCMTWGVKDVEGSIAKEVPGSDSPDLSGVVQLVKVDLPDSSSSALLMSAGSKGGKD